MRFACIGPTSARFFCACLRVAGTTSVDPLRCRRCPRTELGREGGTFSLRGDFRLDRDVTAQLVRDGFVGPDTTSSPRVGLTAPLVTIAGVTHAERYHADIDVVSFAASLSLDPARPSTSSTQRQVAVPTRAGDGELGCRRAVRAGRCDRSDPRCPVPGTHRAQAAAETRGRAPGQVPRQDEGHGGEGVTEKGQREKGRRRRFRR